MKKQLFYSILAAGSLFLGGMTAYALTEKAPSVPAKAVLEGSEWVFSPVSGGTTATLPNSPSKVFQAFTFTMDGIEVDYAYSYKVKVKYAGESVPMNTWAHLQVDDGDDPADYYGWSFAPTSDYDGVQVRVNYQVFSKPGTIEISLEEGAFDTMDGDLSPAVTYTHTFGDGGSTPETPVEISLKNTKPAAGSTVKSLSNVTLRFDVSKLGDNQVFCDGSQAHLITLAKDGDAAAVQATSVEFDEMAYEEETIPYTVSFPTVTEAGEYTVTVPAGFFWAAAEMGEKPADALINDEITVKYTVDPDARSGMQLYEVYSPAQSPESVDAVEAVIIKFTDIDGQILFDDEAQVTLTKDGAPLDGVSCYLSWCWEFGNMTTAQVSFEKDEDYFTVTAPGDYELTIPAGAIYAGDDKCDEIKVRFTIGGAVKTYTWTATPENNGKIDLPSAPDGYTQFTFAINGAGEVSYDEWEDPNHDPLYGTTAKAIQVTYNGESVKNVANVAADGDENIGYSLRSNWDEPEIVIGISNQVFSKGGVLSIVIDEGRCTADGSNPTPEIRYTCTVGEAQGTKDYEVKVSPAMDAATEYTIDYFQNGFKIEFTNALTVEPNMVRDWDDDDNPVMVLEYPPHLKVGDVVYYGEVNVDAVDGAECPTFIITYPEMFDIDTSLGGYVNFSVDEGTFTVDGKYNSPAISQTWRLKRTKEVDTSYTFGPAGDIVNQGYGLFAMISFSIDEYIALDRSDVVVSFNGAALQADDYTISVLNGDNKCIYLQLEGDTYLDPALTGTLSIDIPANAISVSGVMIEEPLSHTWNVVLPKSFTYNAAGLAPKYTGGPTYDYQTNNVLTTDLPEVADLSEIIFEIPDATNAELWKKSYINLRSRDYMTYGAHMPDEVEEVAGTPCPTFRFKFNDAPTVETVYELSLNLGAFYVDDAHMSPSLDFAVILNPNANGIKDVVAAGEGKYTVVSVDGRVLFVDGSLEQVKALAKGFYIINGKKQIIK